MAKIIIDGDSFLHTSQNQFSKQKVFSANYFPHIPLDRDDYCLIGCNEDIRSDLNMQFLKVLMGWNDVENRVVLLDDDTERNNLKRYLNYIMASRGSWGRVAFITASHDVKSLWNNVFALTFGELDYSDQVHTFSFQDMRTLELSIEVIKHFNSGIL